MAIAIATQHKNITFGNSYDGGSGSGRTMLFMCATNSGSDSVTGVTWNGEAFTKIGSRQSGSARYITAWYLIPSGTGSAVLSVTGSGCCENNFLIISGTDGAAPKNFNTAGGNTSGTVSVSVTANDGDWLFGSYISNVAGVTMGANTTNLSDASSNGQATSNGVSSPTALAYSISAGDYALLGWALAPGATSAIKTINGLAKGSVKTVDGLAIASVKTWNGLE